MHGRKNVEKRLTVLLRANGDDLRWCAFATQRSGCDVDVIKSVGLKLLQRILRHRRNRSMTAIGGEMGNEDDDERSHFRTRPDTRHKMRLVRVFP